MDAYPFTPQQLNIWNLQKFYEGTAIANQCGAVFFHEDIPLEQICDALKIIVQKQTALRLRFGDGDALRQYVSEDTDIKIPVLFFEDESELDAYASKVASTPLCEENQPLYRFFAFRVKNQSGVLAVLNHMITDAWSFSLLVSFIDRLLKVDAIPEGDYCSYIEKSEQYKLSARCQRDADYWKSKYQSRPEITFIRPESDVSNDAEARRIQRKPPEGLNSAIRGYCDKNRISPAVFFETVVMIYLSKLNPGNKTATIGIPVLNRTGRVEKQTVGMYISTMPLTVEIDETMTVKTILQQVTAAQTEVFRHQQYPYSDILRSLREQQSFEGNLYEVMVSFQNAETKTNATTKWYFNGYSEVPLVIHIDDRDGKGLYSITMDYQVALFPQDQEVDYLFHRLEYIMEQITGKSEIELRDISIVPEEEKNVLLKQFNDTFADYPRDKCVHELFTEQARKTPGKVALVFENESFTYKELDHMSDALANSLLKCDGGGVIRNSIIPIIARRDWRVIVAMLGVLKAGCAYMLVSPDYPVERICTMIEMAESSVILHYGYDEWQILERKLKTDIEEAKQSKAMLSLTDLKHYSSSEKTKIRRFNKPEDLCYIVQTSGSTGEPKLLSVSHRNAVNFSYNSEYNNAFHSILKDGQDRMVSVTNIIFDLFVTETVFPLTNGLTIFMTNEEESMSQQGLAMYVERHGIEILQTTPTKMQSFMINKSNLQYLQRLKTIILGGEVFPQNLYYELRRNSDARIFSIYGPAETTVWNSNKELKSV